MTLTHRADYASQDEYCQSCLCLDGCNVILEDEEECGDRAESSPLMSR